LIILVVDDLPRQNPPVGHSHPPLGSGGIAR